jgi:hypothetical protein
VPTQRVLTGVIEGFLGTYCSRYSKFKRYWLFGFLVEDLTQLTFDLIVAPPQDTRLPLAHAHSLAILKFQEQVRKASLAADRIVAANLRLTRGAATAELAGDRYRFGYLVSFRCSVRTDTGRDFERTRAIFVGPHDPALESASAR